MNARRRYVSNASTCASRWRSFRRSSASELDAKPAGLDGLPQPHALGVVGDVLDLVRDRARVDLAQARQGLEQRLAGNAEPEQPCRDARLQLVGVSGGWSRDSSRAGSPIGSEPSGSRRAFRCPCVRYAFTSDIAAATPPRSSLVRSGGAAAGASAVREAPARQRGRAARPSRDEPRRRRRRRRRALVALDETLEARKRASHALVAPLEQLPPRGIDGLGVVEVLLEELADVSGVEAQIESQRGHGSVGSVEPAVGQHGDDHAEEEGNGVATPTATAASVRCACVITPRPARR